MSETDYSIARQAADQAELAGQPAEPETNPSIALFINIGAGGVAAMILFLVPRTIAVVALLRGCSRPGITGWRRCCSGTSGHVAMGTGRRAYRREFGFSPKVWFPCAVAMLKPRTRADLDRALAARCWAPGAVRWPAG